MKVTTNPKTGVTTCDMHDHERDALAKAKTIMEQVAFHARGGPGAEKTRHLADALGEFLATEIPAAKTPEPPAE